MAKIFPSGWDHKAVTGAAAREIETLAMLHRRLPDDYAIYHGVHWTRLRSGFSIFGEADFIVVNPAGRMLVIEQKSGFLEETPGGLVKLYSDQRKSVSTQIARTVSNLYGRMSTAFGPGNFKIEELLYCPDYRVKNSSIAGVNPARIVDATRRDKLASVIEHVLPRSEPPLPCSGKLHAFLANELSLVPDVAAMIDESSKLTTRISDGLATWARNIEFEPFRLRVIGTAGSGKTQLAVRVMQDAVASDKRPLYVCYNRPLADHLRTVVPSGATVMSYHQLCVSLLKPMGVCFDFSNTGVFPALEEAFARCELPQNAQYDVLIVDEGQDFPQAWVPPLARLLAPGGRWWWLEDPTQNLYGRLPLALSGWVEVRASINYRTPRDILRMLEKLSMGKLRSEAASPFDESGIGAFSYVDGSAEQATREAIDSLRAEGFRGHDIVVLSFQGRDKSQLASLDKLGEYKLGRFTGTYDNDGIPVHRTGDVRFESVFRFKGQCAPCIILTEIDFDALDEAALRRIFVGATRATVKLVLVMSDRVARMLTETL